MAAVGRLDSDRSARRAGLFEQRFTAQVMARSYLQLYWRLYRGIEGCHGEQEALELVS